MWPRQTTDPWGRQVLLTKERWEHIVGEHPELKHRDPEVLATVPSPDVITPDPIPGRWRYWAAGFGVSRWMFVVVDRHQPLPIIVTAFSTRRRPI